MDAMPDMRPEAPRYLREQDAPDADARSKVDVTELLSRLTERTEELAEARVKQKAAEADLRRTTRQLTAQRKAHGETSEQLETDRRELEEERDQVVAERRELEAEVAREMDARAALEAELEQEQERVHALQRRLQVAWAELQQAEPEPEERRWWNRRGS
jgi:chromosome segregation ATPase